MHIGRAFSSVRKGNITVLAAICLVVVVAMVAFAIDVGAICLARTELQRAADVGAYAAVGALYDKHGEVDLAGAANAASDYVAKNKSGRQAIQLSPEDILVGTYDETTGTVSPNFTEPDAVQVFARRTEAQGTAAPLFFASVFGRRRTDVSAMAIARISRVSRIEALPIALRTPDFGPVDPNIAEVNPGKDGPSGPRNNEYFEAGEQITVFVFGRGKKPSVHLSLNTHKNPSFIKDVLEGITDAQQVEVGDEYPVSNQGTGQTSLGVNLATRLDTAWDDPMRDVVLPVVRSLHGSRDEVGVLHGKVRVVDFVSVHLDQIVPALVPDPKSNGDTIEIELLVGTVTRRRVNNQPGGPQPDGVGGGTVMGFGILVQ